MRGLAGEDAVVATEAQHDDAIVELRQRWRQLHDAAGSAEDTAERRVARRVASQLTAVGTTATDPAYLEILRSYRPARGQRR